jgi:trk system potassium uptake protein
MKAIVMGCGRTGQQVSHLLADAGNEVTVIDASNEALAQLGPDFKGRRVRGIGFDYKTLVDAGIEEADAFAATSPSDNINIIAARIARTVFHVPRVVARLYDPRRAEIYQRLGLTTISMINWGAERIFEIISHANLDPVHSFGKGEVFMTNIEVPAHLAGRTVRELSIPEEIAVVAITRKSGEAVIPSPGAGLFSGDIVHLVVHTAAMDRLDSLLGY